MNWILLLIVISGVSIQGIMQKAYNIKVSGGTYIFNTASIISALVVFLISAGGKFNFTSDILPYSLLFAVSYGCSGICYFMAIKTGPLSVSSLISSYSLIIPTVYGIIILGEPIKNTLIAGIVLLLISLVLVNLTNGKNSEKTPMKWWIYILVSFIGNGMCSVIQKVQQLTFDGKYKSELMIISLITAAVIMFFAALMTERKTILKSLKKGLPFYLICGLANGVVNLLVLVLANRLPVSVMFPIISAGGIILTTFISVFIYKEKLTKKQVIGFFLGILSIILLNI